MAQFSSLLPAGMAVILLILAVFGGISYKWYEYGSTWQGWVMFVALFAVFALFVGTLKRMFQRYTGRIVFALWVIAILGAYFAYLVSVPVPVKDAAGKPLMDANGRPVVERVNQYPMGNDLAGGTELIYALNYDQTDRNLERTRVMYEDSRKVDSNSERTRQLRDQLDSLETSKKSAPDKAAEVVRHRVDPNGTKGIPVTTFGNNRERLRIQLPRASEAEVARIEKAIDTQGRLEFHIVTDRRDIIDATRSSKDKDVHDHPTYHDPKDNNDYVLMTIKTPKKFSRRPDDFNTEDIVMNRTPGMDGSHITLANSKIGENGRWEIQVRFDAQGSVDFALLTGANVGKRMAIVLDNEAKSAPTIQNRIEGVCQITGNFTKDEADKLAGVLTAGSLPAEVRQESKFFVGPSLGAEQIQSGVLATIIATGVVIVFMLIYYRLAGAIAALCMLLNLPMLLGLMGFFKATLTLPGIAGIVLTLGMAVDANVLIIERLREELARGRSMRQAVSHGFERAFLTIIDCHMTTLISSMVLYYLGTGPVRGFAVSLSLGILTTLFCNLWLNWIITEWLVAREAVTSLHLMQFFRETHIDFMGSRRTWMTITGGAAVISLALFLYFTTFAKDKNSVFDVDFTGGTLVQFNFAKGKARDDASVKKDISAKVEPNLAQHVDTVIEKLRKVEKNVKPDMKERDLALEIIKELPDSGDTIAKEAASRSPVKDKQIDPVGGIESIVADLQKVSEQLKKGGELTVQSFGQPDASEAGKYRSFTVTSRIVNPIVTGELGNTLRSTFAGELDQEPVEMKNGAPVIRIARTDWTKDEADQKLKTAVGELAKDPANAEIRSDLNALSVSDVAIDPATGYLEAKVAGFPAPANGPDGKPTADSLLRTERMRQALTLASIKDRIGGPISRTNAFGAQVASETGLFSILALLVANLAVFVYLWFRFEFSGAWGFGAIVALIHDVVIAAGAVIVAHVLGFPILMNLNIVAALLTITGFSVNDTIVVFDRIREVKAAHPTRSYEDIVNEACNATLSRTILTSLTVLLSVISLLIFGGPTIKDMAFTLLIGFTVGTYSSIFIASPLMIWWYRRFGSGKAPVPSASRQRSDTPTAANAQI